MRRDRVRNYVWAALTTAAALGVRLAMGPVLGNRIPYATFYLAVAIATTIGGAGPGIVTALLGGLACAYFIVQPGRTLLIEGADNQLGFGLYLGISAILIYLSDRQRRASASARAAAELAGQRLAEIEREAALRRAAEESERRQKEWFQTTLSSIGDAVIATDSEGRVSFMNKVAEALTGWSLLDAKGQPVGRVFDIHNEFTGAKVDNPASRAIREGQVVGLANHTVLTSKDGATRAIDDSGAPIVSLDGKITGAVLVFRDVSAAKRREAELRNRERMINLAHDAIIVLDAERRIQFWNLGSEEIYGWTAEEARGKVIHELLRSHGRDLTMGEIGAVLEHEGVWQGELRHTAKDGREIVCESRMVVTRNAAGELSGILEINRDVTARVKAEEELKRTAEAAAEGQRTLEALMQHIPEGIAIAGAPDGRILMVSRHGAEMAGKPAAELIGRPASEHPAAFGFHRPDGGPRAAASELPLARAIEHGEITNDEEWSIRRPDGTVLPIRCAAAPIRGADGRITGGLMGWRDVSQWKSIEEQLRQTAKLESLGVLAGGIAHDFNNLLTGVLGNASLLSDVLPEGSFERRCADQVANAAQRAARLTQQMLAYSGKGRFVIERVDVSAFIRETSALIHASIPKHVELRLQLEDGLPPVEADASQLQQIVMNLIINGAEAISPEGGCVTVATSAETIDAAYIRTLTFHADVSPGLFVVIEVQDTGCGMDEATISRMFDPFFTTKFTGRGLGLAAVHGIVRGHGGGIKVHSAPGAGTTFRVLLPAAGAIEAAEPDPPTHLSSDGSGTVLVVDDEDLVRETARTALEKLGYEVVLASNGNEAAKVLRSAPDRFKLVLLDMTMPGTSGEETMFRLREVRPDIPILLASGFSESEALSRFGGLGLAGFLQKPYTAGTLLQKIRSAAASAS